MFNIFLICISIFILLDLFSNGNIVYITEAYRCGWTGGQWGLWSGRLQVMDDQGERSVFWEIWKFTEVF